MKILLLGGTAFLGRTIARQAAASGHDVTCLARGSSSFVDGVRVVRADRDQPLPAEVTGERWDAVIDVSRQPGHVRSAAGTLTTRHWVYVSTMNVYADPATRRQTEDAPLLDPLDSAELTSPEDYGRAKVVCEQAVLAACPDAALLRSGLITGAGDHTGRLGYWPWRMVHPAVPGRVLVPDAPEWPVQFLDVDEVARFTLLAAEQRLAGAYNVCGTTRSLGEVLDIAASLAPDRPALVSADRAWLDEQGVGWWMGPRSLPLVVDDPDWIGFCDHDNARAVAAGLVPTDVREGLRRALAHEEARTPDEPRACGLSDQDETELLSLLDR